MNGDQIPVRGLPETPWEALGPAVQEQVILDDHVFLIRRPTQTDRLLDHPFVQSAFAEDEYLPYWADLWPAARMLARAVLRESWTPGVEALEIGCGLGLAGVAALAKGLRVTFSDYDATALRFASDNARLNGFEQFQLLQMDWRSPPENWQVPIILASDLVYELRHVAPLVGLIKRLLLPQGICLLTDQDRVPAQTLRETLIRERLEYTTQPMRAGEPGGRRVKGTLYHIRHVGSGPPLT